MHTDKPPLRTIQGDGQLLKDAATEQLIRWVITGDDATTIVRTVMASPAAQAAVNGIKVLATEKLDVRSLQDLHNRS